MASSERLVHFKGGFVANWAVVECLLNLEARGARFELVEPDRFRVIPSSLLTADDLAFLRAHRTEARAVLAYPVQAS
jgi:hypothetical protein